MRSAPDLRTPQTITRLTWVHKPEFQWIGPRRLLCLLCARVISTNARTRAAHEKGIEHRVALAELGR